MSWKDKFPKENRYFETDSGILYYGDCSKITANFSYESINLVLTDPPYNIADSNKLTKVGNKIKTNKEAWGTKFQDKWGSVEEYFDWLINIISVFRKILKETGSLILFLDRKYTGHAVYLIERRIGLKFKNKIYFEKHNPLPCYRKNNYRSCMEEAIWFTKSFGRKYNINFVSQKEMKQIFKGNIGGKFSKHPTEKYKWMIEPLVIRHSEKNDIILDCFFGSGTTSVVAELLGRRWIGIEISQEYCEMAKQRILNSLKPRQIELFK